MKNTTKNTTRYIIIFSTIIIIFALFYSEGVFEGLVSVHQSIVHNWDRIFCYLVTLFGAATLYIFALHLLVF